MSFKIVTEKDVLANMLRKYREMPCLWDTTNQFYTNKVKRKEHYEELLEIYKMNVKDAHVSDIRNKIDHMRTTYKREYAKIMKSRMKGEEYKPTLWYYDLLKFLDEPREEDSDSVIETEDNEDTEDVKEDDYKIRIKKNPIETIIPEKKRKFELEEDEAPEEYSINIEEASTSRTETSAAAFGRSVGMQLDEVHPMQRFMAEKLISDVIFLARLEKLNTETQINISGE